MKLRLVQKGRTASSSKMTTTTRSRSAFARPAAKTTGGEQIGWAVGDRSFPPKMGNPVQS